MKKEEQHYILDNKFSEWFEDPGRGYIPTPEAEAKHLKHRSNRIRRKYRVNLKVLEVVIIGFVIIVFCGIGLYYFLILWQLTIKGW